jgi:hypothetical protein
MICIKRVFTQVHVCFERWVSCGGKVLGLPPPEPKITRSKRAFLSSLYIFRVECMCVYIVRSTLVIWTDNTIPPAVFCWETKPDENKFLRYKIDLPYSIVACCKILNWLESGRVGYVLVGICKLCTVYMCSILTIWSFSFNWRSKDFSPGVLIWCAGPFKSQLLFILLQF